MTTSQEERAIMIMIVTMAMVMMMMMMMMMRTRTRSRKGDGGNGWGSIGFLQSIIAGEGRRVVIGRLRRLLGRDSSEAGM